jgi:predicted nucleic acid-binding protein
VEVFRPSPRLDLPAVAPIDEIVTCLPIIQEVLQGFRDETAFRTAREAMLALPIVESPLRVDLFLDAVGLYRAARRAGLTVRSGVDCLIAACAIRHDLTLLHRDRDFPALATVSPLKQRSAGAP